MFGAGETSDKEAMVQHMFAGSWKTGKLTNRFSAAILTPATRQA